VESCTALAEDFEGNIHLLKLQQSGVRSLGAPAMPIRNDSVGRKGMASRILSQDEARARRGPIEGP
jgi:hypothetical protein